MVESGAYGELKLFCGTANPALGEEISAYLHMSQGRVNITRFADGEIYVRLGERAGGGRVCPPVDLPPGERAPRGAADHGGRAAAGVGRADYCRHAILRVRA